MADHLDIVNTKLGSAAVLPTNYLNFFQQNWKKINFSFQSTIVSFGLEVITLEQWFISPGDHPGEENFLHQTISGIIHSSAGRLIKAKSQCK